MRKDKTSATISVVGKKQIEQQEAFSVEEVLRNLPGVYVQTAGTPGEQTRIRIRGADGDQILVLMDGVQVNSPWNGNFDFADLSTDNVDTMSKSVAELEAALEKHTQSVRLGKVSAGFIHDLKSPIDNVIRVTRHLVKHIKDKKLKEFSRELLEEESKNINKLISKVREPMADYSPAHENININDVLSDVFMSFERKLEDQQITLKKELAQSGMLINGDRFNLERVIKNIINNAIEAMDGGGTLTVISKKESGLTIVSVSDTGSGIEPEKLKTLFTKPGSGKKEGWGIGLSVSKELIEKMDGKIKVESEPGKGATFTLQFKSQ